MDTQIENHLPLITSRLVFASKVFPSPSTITSRMEFPSINIEARDDSPVPENGEHQHRAGTPDRSATTLKRASTLRATPKRASTPRASAIAHRPLQRINVVGPSSTQGNAFDFDSLSPLTEDEDMDKHEETSASEAEHEEGVGEGLIPKPKGEVNRPGRGGYNLIKALGWNQKTYDSVLVLVTKVARDKLDTTQSYRGQSKKKVQQLVETVRKKYAFIEDYDKDWPVHDMLKTYLKNRSQTARNVKGRETAEAIDQIAKQASSSRNKD